MNRESSMMKNERGKHPWLDNRYSSSIHAAQLAQSPPNPEILYTRRAADFFLWWCTDKPLKKSQSHPSAASPRAPNPIGGPRRTICSRNGATMQRQQGKVNHHVAFIHRFPLRTEILHVKEKSFTHTFSRTRTRVPPPGKPVFRH